MTEPPPPDPADPAEDPLEGADESPSAEHEAGRRGRRSGGGGAFSRLAGRRPVILIGAVVAVLVIVVVALLLTQNRGGMEPLTVETTTVVIPPPTPDEDPIERDTSTPLLAALPDSVLQYAVSEQVEAEAMLDLDALEGWQLTYSAGDDRIVLQVGQWPTTEEATEAATTLLGEVPESAATVSGDVVVDGEPVGTFTTTFEADGTTERTVWSNSTAVFVAEGPRDATRPFYDAYPF